MKSKSKFAAVLQRVFGVILTAGFCLMLATFGEPSEPSPEAEKYSPLITATLSPSPEPEYFTLSFIGDCTPAAAEGRKDQENSYESVVAGDWQYPFSLTKDFFADDDFTFANLECALTDADYANTKAFMFRADPEYSNILKEGGADFVTLANNHILDCGEEGYRDTKTVLDERGISYVGRNEYTIYETDSGLKIGIYGDSFTTKAKVQAGIAALKEGGAELIIAALHWGDEGSYSVNDLQHELGHAAVDSGAHFVYGSHPHTLQPHEEYNGGVIYYSLGNWTFGGNTVPRDPDTIILKLSVVRDTEGNVSIAGHDAIPCAFTGDRGGNDYRPKVYEVGSEDYRRTLSKINGTYSGPDLSINYTYTIAELS